MIGYLDCIYCLQSRFRQPCFQICVEVVVEWAKFSALRGFRTNCNPNCINFAITTSEEHELVRCDGNGLFWVPIVDIFLTKFSFTLITLQNVHLSYFYFPFPNRLFTENPKKLFAIIFFGWNNSTGNSCFGLLFNFKHVVVLPCFISTDETTKKVL